MQQHKMATSSNLELSCYCQVVDDAENSNKQDQHDRSSACSSVNRPRPIFDENFRYSHSTCFLCNGYFGPCFGEPVCATCHAFVFPDNVVSAEPPPIFSEKTDDGDSGNDEPTDMCTERWLHQKGGGVPPVGAAAPSPPIPLPLVPVPLSRRLDMLSIPRQEGDTVSPGLVERLPPEVLLTLFSYLDDLSLWSCAHVCKRWHQLLMSHVPDTYWERHTAQRWPLFRPLYTADNWFRVYGQLMTSCHCYTCLQQMSAQAQPPGEENSWRKNRLRIELKTLRTDPPEGIEAIPLDQKCCHWQATITGPADSPYAGGLFYLYLQVPDTYPMCPPVVRFLTRIFHPNVSRHGDVGIDSIHHNWSLALTISKVLISIQSLLTDPFCQVCMEPEIGLLYQRDKETFENIARTWTWRYAMHDTMKPHRDPFPH